MPAASAPYFIGANRKALAYAGCLSSQIITGNDLARDNIQGRSFWFELDGDGFPNGRGIHNGPLLSGRVGSADLVFN